MMFGADSLTKQMILSRDYRNQLSANHLIAAAPGEHPRTVLQHRQCRIAHNLPPYLTVADD